MGNLKYKDYIGSIDYIENDNFLTGKVMGLSKVVISYKGNTIQELKSDFVESVEKYIGKCKRDNTEPQKSFTGAFNLRVSPDIHAKAVLKAKELGLTLNGFVRVALEEKLDIKRVVIEKTP